MKALIKFLKENVDEDEVCSTIRRMYQTRFPFHVANPTLHALLLLALLLTIFSISHSLETI